MEQKLEFLNFTLRRQSDYIEFHKHECYELVYYVNGKGCTTMDGNTYNYGSNNFTIMKPSCIHDESHFEETDVIFIGFKSDITSFLKNGLYMDDPQKNIYNYLKNIKKEVLEQRKNFNLKVDFLLGELLIEIERMNEQSNKRSMNFTYILGYIDEHYNQQIDLKSLAELSGYSYHRFRHLFKEITGLSPINYIIGKRLKNATKLLEQTDLSILEISQECGFSNESQFASMFKDHSGQTPSVYRKAFLSKNR
ncbi:MAG: AraC family transcriptional regulator [Clostridia bacterium]|nr:AraC family transcriptional regulator [Clostridia bacterium]